MPVVQLIPPGDGRNNPIRINTRIYSAPLGSALQAPDFDADMLEANGWIKVASMAGTSPLRPIAPYKGQDFHDSSLGRNIRYDGKVWRDPSNGQQV